MAVGTGLRERKKLETWRAIREAAMTLFAQRSYENVSVAEIAAAANVSSATFFNYFPVKEAVVFDPDPADAATVRQLLHERPSDEPTWTSLGQALLAYVAGLGQHLVVHKRLRGSSTSLMYSGREIGDRISRELRDWITNTRPDTSELEAALQVNLAMAGVSAAYSTWQPGQGVPALADMIRTCLARVETGLAEPAPGRAGSDSMAPRAATLPSADLRVSGATPT